MQPLPLYTVANRWSYSGLSGSLMPSVCASKRNSSRQTRENTCSTNGRTSWKYDSPVSNYLVESRDLAFESGERKSSRAVLMFQQPHQLGRLAGLPEGPFEQRRGGFHFRIVEAER